MGIFSLFRRKPVPESKSLSSPESWLQELFGAVPTSAGITISVEDALRVPACASAIRVLSEAVASLDLSVTEIGAGGMEKTIDHPALAILRGSANDWTSGHELIRDLMVDALMCDAGGVAIVTRNPMGRIVEAIHYRPGTVTVETNIATGEPHFRSSTGTEIPAGSVIHVRAPLGRAPLTLAREAIASAAVMGRHAAGLFSRGARPSGVLSFVKAMNEDATKKAIAAWKSAMEGDGNTGKTAFLFDGAEFKPIGLTSTDAQFLENRTFQNLEIARAFRVPPSMLFELDRATWSNTEQMGREFLVYSLEPWLCLLEAALARSLFLPEERDRLRIRFDRDDLTRADLSTRATTINSLIASQVINPNEGRAWLGLEPRPGGDEFLNPNITPAAKPDPQSGSPEDEDPNAVG